MWRWGKGWGMSLTLRIVRSSFDPKVAVRYHIFVLVYKKLVKKIYVNEIYLFIYLFIAPIYLGATAQTRYTRNIFYVP